MSFIVAVPNLKAAVEAAAGTALPWTMTAQDGSFTYVHSNNIDNPPTVAIVNAGGIVVETLGRMPELSMKAQLAALLAAGSPARQAIAANTAFVNAAKPGTAAAQASAAYDQAVALSQVQNRELQALLRMAKLLMGLVDSDG